MHLTDIKVNSYYKNQSVKISSSSIGTTAHCGLWPVEKCPSIFSYLPPTLSIFSLPALEDLFLLPLSIPFFSSLPVLASHLFKQLKLFWPMTSVTGNASSFHLQSTGRTPLLISSLFYFSTPSSNSFTHKLHCR